MCQRILSSAAPLMAHYSAALRKVSLDVYKCVCGLVLDAFLRSTKLLLSYSCLSSTSSSLSSSCGTILLEFRFYSLYYTRDSHTHKIYICGILRAGDARSRYETNSFSLLLRFSPYSHTQQQLFTRTNLNDHTYSAPFFPFCMQIHTRKHCRTHTHKCCR